MVSLNIEGIKGNSTYLNSLLSPENIVCIQEHWLWDFETNIMDQFSSDFDYYIRCTDTFEDKITDQYVPRGKGGICILWHKSLSRCVK